MEQSIVVEGKNRIQWMDGLKGIACILIFVHHFLLVFYPAIHYGGAAVSYLDGYDIAFSQSPLSVVVNGNFMVALFCVISGVVISMQIMGMSDKDKLAEVVLKRYFRLMFPLFLVGLLVYLFLRLNFFTNIETAALTQSPWASVLYQEPITFVQFLESVFINIWFYGDNTLSTAFWMLSSLFFGTFLSIILSVISWKFKKKAWIIYVFVLICLFNVSDLKLAFVFGTLLAWAYINVPKIFNQFVGWIALIIGLFLGGYPSGVIPTNIYRFLSRLSYTDLHIIGAFFTLYGIWSCKILQKILSLRIFQWLGEISYSVYLIHIPLLFTVSTSIFLLTNKAIGYLSSVVLSFGISLILLIIISFIYHRYVEKSCTLLQKKLFNFLQK